MNNQSFYVNLTLSLQAKNTGDVCISSLIKIGELILACGDGKILDWVKNK